jgi:hypothetical protein
MNKHQENGPFYENIEFNLSTGQTDYDLAANQATFSAVNDRYPSHIQIRTNQTISVRLNRTTDHAITITSTDSPFSITGVQIRNVFLSNSSGSTAAVKLLFTNNPN